MVRANSLMRSTAAAYSLRSPGLRRDRKTVISIVLIPFLESIDRRATKFMETRLAACHGCATACSGQLEFRLAITRANLNVIFGVIFLPRQIDLDRAAGASAINFHQSAPFDCSAVCSIAAISASDKPK